MQFLTIVKTIITLIPLLIQAITAIEQAFPQSGQGASKLEAVKATLQGAADVSADMAGQFETIWPVIQKVIGSVVSLANAAGAFKK